MPRRTNRRRSRCGRLRTAPSASACRRSERRKRWCAAASRTFWSAIRLSGTRKLRRLAALAQDATIALCFDSAEQVDAASRVATGFRRRARRPGRDRCRHGALRRPARQGRGRARAPHRGCAGPEIPRAAGLSRSRAASADAPAARPGDRVRGRRRARDARCAARPTILPAKSWPAPAPAPSRSRRKAASTTSCRSARTSSWTPTTPRSATRTAGSTPRSSTACSCSPR